MASIPKDIQHLWTKAFRKLSSVFSKEQCGDDRLLVVVKKW
jgi:hypothetical protein